MDALGAEEPPPKGWVRRRPRRLSAAEIGRAWHWFAEADGDGSGAIDEGEAARQKEAEDAAARRQELADMKANTKARTDDGDGTQF